MKQAKQLVRSEALVARCGLYCGACSRYLNNKCPGCEGNKKAAWCKIRTCCNENGFSTCAECDIVENVADCKKRNHPVSKLFAFVFNSDRHANITYIQQHGKQAFADVMVDIQRPSIPRRGKSVKSIN